MFQVALELKKPVLFDKVIITFFKVNRVKIRRKE